MAQTAKIKSTDYLILSDGQPTVVSATAWHGTLWDNSTHLPLINQQALARLPGPDRAAIENISGIPVEMTPRELMRRARRVSCERAIDHDPAARLEVRAEFRREFYPLKEMLRHPALQECVIPVPSRLPLPYKLATGRYEFYPDELRELVAAAPLLEKADETGVLRALAKAGFIEPKTSTSPADSSAASLQKRDPLAFTAQWYGIENVSNLAHHANFWGGAEALFNFAVRRADWAGRTVGQVIRQMSETSPPATPDYDPAIWQRLLTRQMQHAYKPAHDLMRIYPRMDQVQGFSRQLGITLLNCENERLIEMVPQLHGKPPEYANAAQHKVIAEHSARLRLPERDFNSAVRIVAMASPNDLIPDIRIAGSSFGMPGYEIVKLEKNDPLNLFVGAMVHCCGYIGGDRKKLRLVKATVTHADVGTYVLREEATRTPRGKSVIWLNQNNERGHDLVINAWHSHPGLKPETVQSIAIAIANAARDGRPDIQNVYMGRQGRQQLSFPLLSNVPGTIAPSAPELRTRDTNKLYVVQTPPSYAAEMAIPR